MFLLSFPLISYWVLNDRTVRSSFSGGIQFAPSVYGVTWITIEPLHNAHLGDGGKWSLVFLKDHTRALFLALVKSIYQPLKLLTPDPLDAMPFFTDLVHGAGHQRPLRRHSILSIILVIKLMRKVWSFFCLGILIATSLGLYLGTHPP